MGEPEHTAMHNYAYHPSVANWVHSTSLATQFDGTNEDPTEPSPDDFYRSAPGPPEYTPSAHVDAMTTTRQRQTSNGAVGAARTAYRPAPTAALPSPPNAASRPSPQLPVNRPTVKSLAQKFNVPSSTESSPTSARVRSTRPSPSPRSANQTPVTTSSPARPVKETSYGPHKFNNLKPRERPQPAPPSPAQVRRANGGRRNTDEQTSPSRRKPVSNTRKTSQPAALSRQLFFGEVVGEHDATTPGFGIPTADPAPHNAELSMSPVAHDAHIPSSVDGPDPSVKPLFSTQSPVRPRRSPNDFTAPADHVESTDRTEAAHSREPRRRSPPSRIPVASRRLSAASDSSSSNRSLKASSARSQGGHDRTSPIRSHRAYAGRENLPTIKSRIPATTLPASSYRDHRERGKPSNGASGTGLAAGASTAPQALSPRLRNSRERQLHPQGTPDSSPRTSDPPDDLALDRESSRSNTNADRGPKQSHEQERNHFSESFSPQEGRAQGMDRSGISAAAGASQAGQSAQEQAQASGAGHEGPLTLHTSNLKVPQVSEPLSSTTDFEYEESPVLGMPGSFMMTPPMAQTTPPVGPNQEVQRTHRPQSASTIGGELLQARTFQPSHRRQTVGTMIPEDPEQSELGVRESIPIMLSADEPSSRWTQSDDQLMQSPTLSIGNRKWRAEPLDSSGTISYLDEDDSPIDPFSNRETLRPEDSASVAFYHQAGRDWTPKIPSMPDRGNMTLDSEAYSVINKVLNLYHKSPEITPEVAYECRKKIQKVSPVIAQHKDWCSKESTETYLARLLSDANGAEQSGPAKNHQSSPKRTSHSMPSLNFDGPDGLEELAEHHVGGTAIIFPPESRRYSRGSHGSTATTIFQDDVSRADSSSGNQARDRQNDDLNSAQRLLPTTFAPSLPPKDSSSSRTGNERSEPSYSPFLPEIESAGEGLGLSLQAGQQRPLQQHRREPTRPVGPPPPPPPAQFTATTHGSAGAPYTPSVYSRDPPSSIIPSYTKPQPARIEPTQSLTPGIQSPHSGQGATAMGAHNLGGEEYDGYSALHAWDQPDPANEGAADNVPTQAPATDNHTVENGAISGETHPAAFPGEDAETITRRLQRRYRIVRELTKTEHLYMTDLMVITEIWMGTAKEAFPLPQERATVFCNIEELANFSMQLNTDLKNAFTPVVKLRPRKDSEDTQEPEQPEEPELPEDVFEKCTLDNDDHVSVGYVLKTYLPMIEELYTKYLLNHDSANKLIAARQKNEDPAFIGWQFACYKHSKDITDAWDLDSLLVKPVQRLMKYPLLLQSLKEVTPTTHNDYADIEAARQGIIDISGRINDTKKRQETLRQATKEGKKEKKKGFRGIDIVKALTSKTEKAKTGLNEAFIDKEYEKHSQKFGGHFFQIQIILKDVENYREELTTCFVHLNIVALHLVGMLEENQSSNPEIESAWRRNAMALLELRNVLLEDHKTSVQERVYEPLRKLWGLYVRPQKLMDQRKKGLLLYLKYKQALDRKEKIDPKLEDAAQSFLTVNDALKDELPKLYNLTKKCVQAILNSFIMYQKDWWKNCQKKILPLLEHEPEHTTSFVRDMKDYVDRFNSDSQSIKSMVDRLAICNGGLLNDIANFQSPHPSLYTTDDSSSRKSSSRRTESMSSDLSSLEPRHRRSGGYTSQRTVPSFEGPPRSAPHAGTQHWQLPNSDYLRELPGSSMPPSGVSTPRSAARVQAPEIPRDDRTISPASDKSDVTVTQRHAGHSSMSQFPPLDDIFSTEYTPPAATNAFLSPSSSHTNSSRGSAIFNSALPMSDSPGANRSAEELPGTPADPDEPEVLFLAASLFEFNIAHDRREGGIPYLVYVPGEIFDVIGMKGELWLARNQDDPSRTVGWIWEKHFARILPEEV